jgi:hypothetical protein
MLELRLSESGEGSLHVLAIILASYLRLNILWRYCEVQVGFYIWIGAGDSKVRVDSSRKCVVVGANQAAAPPSVCSGPLMTKMASTRALAG